METITPRIVSAIVPGILLVILIAWLIYFARSKNKGALLQVVYLIRHPLIFAAILLHFPVVAVTSQIKMLGNAFTFDQIGAIALVVWMAILASWMVMYTLALALRSLPQIYGSNMPDYLHNLQERWGSRWVGKYRAWLFALLALPTAGISIYKAEVYISQDMDPVVLTRINVLLGIIGVALGVAAAWLLHRLFLRAQPSVLPILNRISDWLEQHFSWLPPFMKAGYGDKNEKDFRHEAAILFFAVTFFFYALGYLLFNPYWPLGKLIQAPTIVYFLLLFLVLGWVLSGMAHWLDRYRVPSSLVLLVITFVMATLFDTNHYYTVAPRTIAEEARSGEKVFDTSELPEDLVPFSVPSPSEVLEARRNFQEQKGESAPMVVVMSSGGGIQAALWTAQVLTGLQEALEEDLHGEFPKAINLISAVSGGSVGAMYYVDAFTNAAAPPADRLDQIMEMASESTMEQAAWGLVYPDLWRLFLLPTFPGVKPVVDRGWAMERAWDVRLQELALPYTDTNKLPGTRMLGDWIPGVEKGWRPAIIFNAAETETGERFLFSTAEIPSNWTTRSFHKAFPGYDVSVATAARMGATFPYIMPLARANLSNADLKLIAVELGLTSTITTTTGTITTTTTITHPERVENWNLADGGYFDNDGIVSALQWLDMILENPETPEVERPKRIVLIQILASERATNVEQCDAEKAKEPSDSRDTPKPSIQWSWVNEFFGPVLTLLNTWSTSQVERGQNEINRFITLKTRQYEDLEILYCVFDLRDSNVLSWQLSPSEITEIEEAWNDGEAERVKPRIERIKEFLKPQN